MLFLIQSLFYLFVLVVVADFSSVVYVCPTRSARPAIIIGLGKRKKPPSNCIAVRTLKNMYQKKLYCIDYGLIKFLLLNQL